MHPQQPVRPHSFLVCLLSFASVLIVSFASVLIVRCSSRSSNTGRLPAQVVDWPISPPLPPLSWPASTTHPRQPVRPPSFLVIYFLSLPFSSSAAPPDPPIPAGHLLRSSTGPSPPPPPPPPPPPSRPTSTTRPRRPVRPFFLIVLHPAGRLPVHRPISASISASTSQPADVNHMSRRLVSFFVHLPSSLPRHSPPFLIPHWQVADRPISASTSTDVHCIPSASGMSTFLPLSSSIPIKLSPRTRTTAMSGPQMHTRYVNNLFHCPSLPTPSSAPTPPPSLAHFITYALHRTRLTSSVTFAALCLLQRLKTRFIATHGFSGHCLFISAFMIASKVICDDAYSNKSWRIVSQGMFALREINQMEHEMCSYLKWQLNVERSVPEEFESTVRRDFRGLGPYPAHYMLPTPSLGPSTHPKPSTSNIPAAIPSFGPGAPPSLPSATSFIPPEKSSRRSSAESHPTPTDPPQLSTPPVCYSNVPSPVNSMSPATPGYSFSPPYHHVHTQILVADTIAYEELHFYSFLTLM